MSKLAEKIAAKIMTTNVRSRDVIVARIQLMERGEDGILRDAGGLSYDSVVQCIDSILQE